MCTVCTFFHSRRLSFASRGFDNDRVHYANLSMLDNHANPRKKPNKSGGKYRSVERHFREDNQRLGVSSPFIFYHFRSEEERKKLSDIFFSATRGLGKSLEQIFSNVKSSLFKIIFSPGGKFPKIDSFSRFLRLRL